MSDSRVQHPGAPEQIGVARAALLTTGTPRQVLARIVPGDPLGICDRSARALAARCLFLDPRRVACRAFALVARGALLWRGEPGLEAWLEDRVQDALGELLDEQADRLACAEPEPWELGKPGEHLDRKARIGGHLAALAGPLGLDAEALELACARFHALPEADRRAFCSIALQEGLQESAGDRPDASADSAFVRARRVLDVFCSSLSPRPPIS